MTTLGDRLAAHIECDRLFVGGGVALLAVSGGSDSVALLDLMTWVAPQLDLEIAVAHIDHGIGADSNAVSEAVGQLADRYGVPLSTATLTLGSEASETIAREERYRALRVLQAQTGARHLVTAHHADDQIETVLFRLVRGTGTTGLAGIPARGPGGLVRPLLPFSKRELLDWLSARFPDPAARIPIHDDPANRDLRHDRSWIRTEILPRMRDRFGPDAPRQILLTAQSASEERAAWSSVLRLLPDLDFSSAGCHVEVARAPFRRYDNVLCSVILRAFAREAGAHIGRKRSGRLLEFVRSGSSGRILELGSGLVAEQAFDRVRLIRVDREPAPASATQIQMDGAGGRIAWGDWEFTWRPDRAGVARRDATSTWLTPGEGTLRGTRPGDRILPIGGVGRRKVRRMLMEARVAARDRAAYPMLVRGDDILWIPGVCRSVDCVPGQGEPAVRVDARTSQRA